MPEIKNLEPSIKQYQALIYLWAIPISERKNGKRELVLDENWLETYDSSTTELGYGWAAWWWKILGDTSSLLTTLWRKKGIDVKVWDTCVGSDWLPQKIIAMTEYMILPKWRVSFSDWTHTDVAGGHLWTARKSRESLRKWWKRLFWQDSAQVVETKTLKKRINNSDWNRWMPLIPVNEEVYFDQSNTPNLKIDPYLLWVLLWDWSMTKDTTISWYCSWEDMESYKDIFWYRDINYHSKPIQNGQTKHSITIVGTRLMELREWLRKYWLIGTYSDTKFIPEEYKLSSIEERYEIVRWLLDTDWNKGKWKYTTYYDTTSKQLADDMAFILRSLWAVVTISSRMWKYRKDWVVIECKRCYSLYIKHRDPDKLFKLDRKKLGLKPKEINKRVISVEQLDETIKWRCITVSNPNWLYITDDFIVTHNSWLWCNRIYIMCMRYPWTRRFIAREELKKLKDSTLLTMREILWDKWLKRDHWYHYNDISWRITLDNWSMIFLLSLKNEPSDPKFTRFWSMELTWWFIDEANECPIRWYWVLISRIRYKLENFCPLCAWKMTIHDRLGVVKVKNPNQTCKDDEYMEKNLYLCPSCKRRNHWLSPKVLSGFNPDKWRVLTKFYRPWSEWTQLDHIKFIKALVTDNKNIPRAYIANLMRMENKIDRERLLHGNFDYDDSPWRLFDYDELLWLFEKPLESQLLKQKEDTDPDYKVDVSEFGKCHRTWYEYRITCDPARHGRDLAIIMVWNKRSIEEIYVYHYSDLTELEQRITILWDKYNIWPRETMVDDDWLWGGIVDHMKCRWFINRSAPIQPKAAKRDPLNRVNYYTIKDQCYFELANNIGKVSITPDNIYIYGKSLSNANTTKFQDSDKKLTSKDVIKRIIEELDAMVEIDIDIDWPKKVIRKKELKAKLWRSPDFGDCMMMRSYWHIKRSKRVFVFSW